MNLLLNPDNHLFELARTGKRLPHIILVIILTFVFIIAAQIVGGIPAIIIVGALSMQGGEPLPLDNQAALLRLLQPDTALEQTVMLVLSFGPIFLILWGWLALVEKRPLWTIGLERAAAGKKYLRGLLIGLVMFAAAIGLSALLGFISFETGNPQQQGLTALGGILLVFLGWMVQGAAEEALARGWVLPTVGARYKPVWGLIVSSVIFALLHSLNPNLNPVAILNLFLFGVFTVLFALYEGGLWGVFSIHTAWNWAEGNLFGFEVSGMLPPGGTLFNLMEVGPDVITGGSFGPEGGLTVTAVLVISSALVWIASRRRGGSPPVLEPHFPDSLDYDDSLAADQPAPPDLPADEPAS
jgi:membrane protease YdiL (CAAX protease family)